MFWDYWKHDASFELLENISESGPQNTYYRTVAGLIVPALWLMNSLACLGWEFAYAPTRRNGFTAVVGVDAQLVAAVYFLLALIVHCHFYWSTFDRTHAVSQIVKFIALALFAIVLLGIAMREWINFI